MVWIGKKIFSFDTIKTKWKLNWGQTNFKLLGLTFNVAMDKILDLNFNDKIVKIHNIIKLWKRKYLTPIDKITVINRFNYPY